MSFQHTLTSEKVADVRFAHPGAFLVGGPKADAGLTSRKIIVETYGGVGRHGGRALSGKDPTRGGHC